MTWEEGKRVVDSNCCIINFTRGCFFAKLRRGFIVVSTEFSADASFYLRLREYKAQVLRVIVMKIQWRNFLVIRCKRIPTTIFFTRTNVINAENVNVKLFERIVLFLRPPFAEASDDCMYILFCTRDCLYENLQQVFLQAHCILYASSVH